MKLFCPGEVLFFLLRSFCGRAAAGLGLCGAVAKSGNMGYHACDILVSRFREMLFQRVDCSKKSWIAAVPQPGTNDLTDEAFRNQILEQLDALFGFAMSLARNRSDAEDLVQETCLKAWRSASGFKAGTNLKAWLFTILRNTFINEYRRRKNSGEKVSLDADEEFSFYAEAYGSLQRSEKEPVPDVMNPDKVEELFGDEITKALESLSDEFREAVFLSDVQELPYQEIAEILEIPIGTVRSRIARARAALQKQLWVYAHEKGYVKGNLK